MNHTKSIPYYFNPVILYSRMPAGIYMRYLF